VEIWLIHGGSLSERVFEVLSAFEERCGNEEKGGGQRRKSQGGAIIKRNSFIENGILAMGLSSASIVN
jgi:hypothetical protein